VALGPRCFLPGPHIAGELLALVLGEPYLTSTLAGPPQHAETRTAWPRAFGASPEIARPFSEPKSPTQGPSRRDVPSPSAKAYPARPPCGFKVGVSAHLYRHSLLSSARYGLQTHSLARIRRRCQGALQGAGRAHGTSPETGGRDSRGSSRPWPNERRTSGAWGATVRQAADLKSSRILFSPSLDSTRHIT